MPPPIKFRAIRTKRIIHHLPRLAIVNPRRTLPNLETLQRNRIGGRPRVGTNWGSVRLAGLRRTGAKPSSSLIGTRTSLAMGCAHHRPILLGTEQIWRRASMDCPPERRYRSERLFVKISERPPAIFVLRRCQKSILWAGSLCQRRGWKKQVFHGQRSRACRLSIREGRPARLPRDLRSRGPPRSQILLPVPPLLFRWFER